ncbi:MAG: protein kinase [bacterium]
MEVLSHIPAPGLASLLSVTGVVAGLLSLFFLTLYKEERELARSSRISLEGKSRRWIEKKVQELVRVEAFRVAADLETHLNRFQDAAELYRKGGNLKRAAESYLAAGMKSEAAEAYLQSHNYKRAAELFLEAGVYDRAARTNQEAGEIIQAAQIYERGGNLDKAAEIYLEQGLFRKAARIYASKKQWSRAADTLWRCYSQERARLPEEIAAGDSMPLRVLARRSGDLFYRAGRYEDAVEAYRAGGWTLQTAKTLQEWERFEQAGEEYLKAGENVAAAECFEKAGRHSDASRLRAHHFLKVGDEEKAVPYLEEAGEYKQAAMICKRLSRWQQAAENFEKSEDFREAAEMYGKSGDNESAARVLERAGDYGSAADYYGKAGNEKARADALEKAGSYLEAGRSYLEQELSDQAISALQKMERDDPGFKNACFILGEIFRDRGMYDLARRYFHRTVEDQEVSRSNLENFYQYAFCSEQLGEYEEAAGLYEKILVLDFHFRDASERLNSIKSSRTMVDTPSGAEQAATVSRGPVSGSAERPGRPSRYNLLEEVGRGGMGIVYKAEDSTLERTVAFKVLPSNLKDHPQALRNFFREAKSAARLNHPNIVTVYDAGEESETYYIAMEFVEGDTIKYILTKEGVFSPRAILVIAGQVCKALEYAHGRRVVHRDIKSSNIMWTPDKQVKIMDFGLAKVLEEVKGYQTIASGTPYYMSPEQVLGKDIDHRTDIYSLGITMFEMATGALPFMQGDATYHHVHTPPPEAKDKNPDVPDELNRIILRCMQKDPDERFENARDLFNAFRSVATA